MKILSNCTNSELIDELRSRPEIIAAKIWTKDEVEDWVEANSANFAVPDGMMPEAFHEKVIQEAMSAKGYCPLGDCTDEDWSRLDDFMEAAVSQAGGKWPNCD
jgi:hypothetical protein